MKILVTGSSGFIGSNLVKRLSKEGYEVAGFSRSPSKAGIPFIVGDVRDTEAVKKACKDVDLIFHMATQKFVPQPLKDSMNHASVNILGTLNLLQESNCDFVYISSAEIYGEPDKIPIPESAILRPKSPYSISHMACENYVRNLSEKKGTNFTIFRLANIYGPDSDSVVSKFVARIKNNEPLLINGDGETIRDLTNVKDVVDAFTLSVESKKTKNDVFNLGTGVKTTINELASLAIGASGKKLEVIHQPAHTWEIRRFVLDISKIKGALDWQPKITLKEGLKEMFP
jgi:UDP-glucose 4-epimerase